LSFGAGACIFACGSYFTGGEPASFNSLVSLPGNSSLSSFIFCLTKNGQPIWTEIMINSENTRVWNVMHTSDGIIVAYSQGGYGETIGNGVIPPSSNNVASPMIVKYLLRSPALTDLNAATAMTSATALASDTIAAANIKALTAAVVGTDTIQKLAQNNAAAIIMKKDDISPYNTPSASNSVNVSSSDKNVAINAYEPSSPAINAVAIAISRISDPAAINNVFAYQSSVPPTLTQISLNKYDSNGEHIESIIGDTSTYDKVKITLKTNTVGYTFRFIHTSNSGVKTPLLAYFKIINPAIGTPIPLTGAPGATVTILSRNSTTGFSELEIFAPFSTIALVEEIDDALPCFVAGTNILTPSGYKLVEDLKTGDSVMTADGRAVMATMYQREVAHASTFSAPFHIPAGTFGKSQPAALTISPLHAVQIRKGVWEIPVDAANRYPEIKQVGLGEAVTYYHIETPNYFRDNLVANGTVVESFGGNQKSRIPAGKYLYTFSEARGGYVRYEPAAANKSARC
jgi:hypothetical protein